MIMRIFDKISKIFFAFICFIVILGMVFLSIRNYTTPIVRYTSVLPTEKIKTTYYFTGTVVPEASKEIEIKASQDMDISNINIKTDQIVPREQILFNLDFSTAMADKSDAQDAINDNLYNANTQLNRLIKSLEKNLNREIGNIDSINPEEGVVIYAVSDGKIKNLSIKEGEKVRNGLISNIIDDSMLKISFEVTAAEYPNISVGQKVLLSFTGYEGYYEAEVKSLNPNPIPDKNKVSYIYNGVIEVKNPGLISPGVHVGVSVQSEGQVVSTLVNAGLVESYAEQLPVTTELVSNSEMDVYLTKLYVIEGEEVKKGQKIAILGGNDLVNKISADIKNIKDTMKQISGIRKDLSQFYDDIITISGDNNFAIDNEGNCTISQKIYVDYVTDKTSLRKDDIIMKYHIYSNDAFSIRAIVDSKTYKNLVKAGDKVYYGENMINATSRAVLKESKEFSKKYELSYEILPEDIGKFTFNDNVVLTFSFEEGYANVIPKTAIVPIGKMAVGSSGYIYIINKEDSMLGNIDVLEEKRVTITAMGDETISIEFDKNTFLGMRDIFIVNYIDSTFKNGMRVKTR